MAVRETQLGRVGESSHTEGFEERRLGFWHVFRGEMLFSEQIPRQRFQGDVVPRPRGFDTFGEVSSGLAVAKHRVDPPELHQ